MMEVIEKREQSTNVLDVNDLFQRLTLSTIGELVFEKSQIYV